jgi:hypothetical protein
MNKASRKKQKQDNPAPAPASDKHRPVAVIGIVATLIIGLGIAAYAANNLLHGHISVTEHRDLTAPSGVVVNGGEHSLPQSPATSPDATSDLIDKYGTAAASPSVVAAIRKAQPAPDAKAATDRIEALAHGYWKPGADPTLAICMAMFRRECRKNKPQCSTAPCHICQRCRNQ